MTVAVLIVAAGRGARAGTAGPKQYVALAGSTILRRSIEACAAAPVVSTITVVIHPDDLALYRQAVAGSTAPLTAPVRGGATRQDSVRLGLEALAASAAAPPDLVLIHDAARPFVSPTVIARVVAALADAPGAIAALPVADTLKRDDGQGAIAATVQRQGIWRAQTPQGFRFASILEAHRRALREGALVMTDDAAIAEWDGMRVALVDGSADNIKLTTAEDLAMAERTLSAGTAAAAAYETRIGQGFDVHRLVPGDAVWLGGVRIAHTHKLDGHSDADVVLHALTDALLGTIGDGDIGQHFPPSDPQWKGAASILFLKDAARRVADARGRIINVDMTILAEAPKVGPHRAAMQAVIGAALSLTPDRVGIKATTTEGLGFTGRREGIAAMASASVQFPAASS